MYLNEEEVTIRLFVEENKKYFPELPEDYIVNGNWPGMEDERKTATREHSFQSEDYPLHFTKTICVFAAEKGGCLLQKVATEKQLHPWKIKPRACWSFPLRGIRNGRILSPPKEGEEDPSYIDESYPGYITFCPCAKPVKDGMSWSKLFYNEIEYYRYWMKQNNTL